MSKRGNREGSIYQRKSDGRFVGAFIGADGKRHALYGATRAEVRDRLVKALRDTQQGVVPSPERETVATYLDRWLSSAEPGLAPATYFGYSTVVERHLKPTLGRITLARLQPEHVEELVAAKTAEGLSPRRVAIIRAVLRRALGQAVKRQLLARNVASLVEVPKQVRHEIAPLSPVECRRFLEHVHGDRLEAFYFVAIATGLRQGELIGLRWSDVNLDTGTITVARSYGRTRTGFGFITPKTATSRRSVRIGQGGVAVLREHRLRQLEERLRLGPAWTDLDLVFPSEVGTPLIASNVTHRFQRLLKAAGIPRRRFHDLRHSAATLLLVQKVSPRVVQDILGHSSVTLTLQTYSHVMPELKEEAAEQMDAILAAR